jgi:hypothetical protein
MNDKVTQALVEALKQSLAEPGEQRLFRSGKLPGLFAGRTSLHAEASAQALRDGLLEVVRAETKGKTPVEWVRITPKGRDFVLNHESPVRAMDELRVALQITTEGVPAWVAKIRRSMQETAERLAEEVHAVTHRLEVLAERIAQSLHRAEESAAKLPVSAQEAFPWAPKALNFLDRRRENGLEAPCPLPELFAAVRQHHEDLTVHDFHTGLCRLRDRGVMKLLPFEGSEELPEPEYALLDGPGVFYYAAR